METITFSNLPPLQEFDLSLLLKLANHENFAEEACLLLPRIKSPLSTLKEGGMVEDLENTLSTLHLKLLGLIKSTQESQTASLLMAYDLQLIIFLKLKEGINDLMRYIIDGDQEEECLIELKKFFWKAVFMNNHEFLPIFLEKIILEDWLSIIFSSASIFSQIKGFQSDLKVLLRLLLEHSEENLPQKAKIIEKIIVSLDYKNKGQVLYEVSKDFVREADLQYQIVIESYVMTKKNQISYDFELFLRGLYTLYKISPQFMRPIILKINGFYKTISNKTTKTALFIFFGRLASFTDSPFFANHSLILESLFCNYLDKAFAGRRLEIIELFFRFLKKFCFIHGKNNKSQGYGYDETKKLSNFCLKSEEKIAEFLFLAEKDLETRKAVLEMIYKSIKRDENFFTVDFWTNFLNSIEQQNILTQETCYICLSRIFATYYSRMFTEDCNIFYNLNRIVVNQGNVECKLQNIQDSSKKFEWIFQEILFRFNLLEKYDYLTILNTLNHALFGSAVEKSENSSYLLGIFYLVIGNLLKEKEQIVNFRNKGYDDFLSRILGNEWKLEEGNLKNKKNFFILRGFEKLLKLKAKLLRIVQETLKKNKDFSWFFSKIYKYWELVQTSEGFGGYPRLMEDSNFKQEINEFFDSFNQPQINHQPLLKFNAKFSDQKIFLLNFLWMNKTFDPKIVSDLIKHCLFFLDQLKAYENKQELLYLISSLKALEVFVKYSNDKVFETKESINSLMEITEGVYGLLEEKKDDINSSQRSEIQMLERFSLTLSLKILSKFTNFLDLDEVSEKKTFFKLMLKSSTVCDESDFKFIALILLRIDEISSEKDFFRVFDHSLENLNVSSPSFCKSINIIHSMLKYEIKTKGNFDYVLKNRALILEKYFSIIQKPVLLSKSLIISPLSVIKAKTLNIIYNLLFKFGCQGEEEKMSEHRNCFIQNLFEILVNLNSISAGCLLADRNHTRIKSLEILFKIIQKGALPDSFTPQTLIYLSYLCFEDNITFRKVFFKFLIKFISILDHSIALTYLCLCVLFTLDIDSTLSHLSRNVLGKYCKILGEKIRSLLENQKLFSTKIFTRSPEYLLIYLVQIIMNNCFFWQNGSTLDIFKAAKLVQNFIDIVFQHNGHFRSLTFLVLILQNLQRKKPKLFNVSQKIDFPFYNLPPKTLKVWINPLNDFIDSKLPSLQNGSSTSSAVPTKTDEEKYEYLIETLSEMMRQNFTHHKIMEVNKEVHIPIDSAFFQSREGTSKLSEISDNSEEMVNLEPKITEKKTRADSKKTLQRAVVSKTKQNAYETRSKFPSERRSKRTKL